MLSTGLPRSFCLSATCADFLDRVVPHDTALDGKVKRRQGDWRAAQVGMANLEGRSRRRNGAAIKVPGRTMRTAGTRPRSSSRRRSQARPLPWTETRKVARRAARRSIGDPSARTECGQWRVHDVRRPSRLPPGRPIRTAPPGGITGSPSSRDPEPLAGRAARLPGTPGTRSRRLATCDCPPVLRWPTAPSAGRRPGKPGSPPSP